MLAGLIKIYGLLKDYATGITAGEDYVFDSRQVILPSKLLLRQDVSIVAFTTATALIDFVRNLMDPFPCVIEDLQEIRLDVIHLWIKPFEGGCFQKERNLHRTAIAPEKYAVAVRIVTAAGIGKV